MSSADVAVRVILQLELEDFQVLKAIELEMKRRRYVPKDDVSRLSGLAPKQIRYRLKRLGKFGLLRRRVGTYVGYALNFVGYDCLALNDLIEGDVLEAFGKPLGVGKESDVFGALTPRNERVAVKFHRLGRASFRQTRRLRGYAADRRHISRFFESRLAAAKEFEALNLVHPHRISVPKPIAQERHVVVMGMIEGADLYQVSEMLNPKKVLDEIIENVKGAYLYAGVIHADLSEFNVILGPDMHVLIIDWPQFVRRKHPNAQMLLKRDVENILRFFKRRFNIEMDLQEVLNSLNTGRNLAS